MAVLVSDSFNRANSATLGTTDSLYGGTAKVWTDIVAGMGITGNQAYNPSVNIDVCSVVDAGNANVKITATMSVYGAEDAIYFRVTDSLNYWRVIAVGTITYLQKFVANVKTNAASFPFTPVAGDVWSIVVNGNAIEVFINGVSKCTLTDSANNTATKHGIGQGSRSATTRFDDFKVEDLATGTTLTGSATLQGVGTLTASGTMTQTGSASLQGVGTLTASGLAILNGSASLQGVGTLSASGSGTSPNPTGSATLQGVGTLTASGVMTVTGSATLQGVGTLQASGGFPISGSASLMGVGTLTASGVIGANIARSVNLLASMVEAVSLFAESLAPVNLQASWISSISLLGSKPEPIALEGGLMTKLKQDFTMFAGDTPPLTFTMTDSTSLSGATVKWGMRKGHVKGPQALLKTTLNGGLSVNGSVVTANLLSADTLSLEGQFYHEAEVTDVSGKVSTVMTGLITIVPSGA